MVILNSYGVISNTVWNWRAKYLEQGLSYIKGDEKNVEI